jgi:5-methylthioribose kinase
VAYQPLSSQNVVAYLVGRDLIADQDQVEIEVFTEGVSSTTISVRTSSKSLVIKQALPELLVAGEWRADVKRSIVEGEALRFAQEITQRNVPKLLDSNPDEYILVMERAPVDFLNWKKELLDNRIDPAIGLTLGRILASWQNADPAVLLSNPDFRELALFRQLRVNPFYDEVQRKNPSLSGIVDELRNELLGNQSVFVHGDFSPKNILINAAGEVIILDFEVAHFGNPVFDISFIGSHLLCKYFLLQHSEAIQETFASILEAYRQYSPLSLSTSFIQHTALLALARVDGLSPVGYLPDDLKAELKSFCMSVLKEDFESHTIEFFPKG